MHLHLLGICGTFMAGLGQLAKSLGHKVTGSDLNVYPPMSDFLASVGIDINSGWDARSLNPRPDCVIIGNALSRGNPLVEFVLDHGIAYSSGPQWLAEHVLPGKHVLAVAGTHGKTTTASLLAWILDQGGYSPGFLIGGIPENFQVPARLGNSEYFVIEADEYDTAFFDKRSKFIHYRPRTLVLNNLEFDHADIFPDLAAIQTQFHHLVRIVPSNGIIVWNADDHELATTLARGCWSSTEEFGTADTAAWRVVSRHKRGHRRYELQFDNKCYSFDSPLVGQHNALNLAAAVAAANAVGMSPERALPFVRGFKNVKRRLELLGVAREVSVYDDFAHHPTAIATTLEGLRDKVGDEPIVAILEPRSNTMRMGVHRATLAPSLVVANHVLLYAPPMLGWDLGVVANDLGPRCSVHTDLDSLLDAADAVAVPKSHLLIMSNGSFGGFHQQILKRLAG
ncbi:MAG: UDP-N-acetylmuramate:L-alanyl-gamma-D-glutamyl-meso-diaminopimelate ligase [Gammaproteobacteria bacterium]|nr:UDP-N-acetylmuramate:L-alanyl-gamma-D-glutamyl-meso-diaminopimelate ligase [Gammaproteobacteria bacterium]